MPHFLYNAHPEELGRALLEDSGSWTSSWLESRNATGTDDEMDYEGGDDTATVLVLALLLFILVSASVFCIRLKEAQSASNSGLNLASDGRTVASVEDNKDVEEGGGAGSKVSSDVPIIVVVRLVKEEEGEA